MNTATPCTRREFLITSAAAAATAALGLPSLRAAEKELPEPSAAKLPRWRGFNLLEKFTRQRNGNPRFAEEDFQMMSDWGFNFARLPMSYLCWSDESDWMKLREEPLTHIDQAIEFGRKYGVHVNLNFHRAPGYCVNPPVEPLDLFKDAAALDACAFHWGAFAKRYKGISNRNLSFDLLNEPKDLPVDSYVRVARRLVEAIRAEDPQRLIIADGLKWGTVPVPALADLKIGQSTRGYEPMQISHYRASWVNGSDKWSVPTWPLKSGEKIVCDRATLVRNRIEPWKALEKLGVGVHVGEWGAFNKTPHEVVLAWMRDCLELWQEAGWGWSLWNLRGSFGVLDSGRTDVAYEDFHGHKVDAAMLKLLRSH